MAITELYAIEGNRQRLDGGAMFGNVPRAMWSRWIAPDQEGRIPLACRALLAVESDGRSLLFETGVGAFFEPKLRERFGVEESEHLLVERLSALGHPHESIDLVVLSHLHFDHAGGLLSPYREDQALSLLFPNAAFVVSAAAMARAKAPHQRDRASYISALPGLLEESGRLVIVAEEAQEMPSQARVSGGGLRSERLGADYQLHLSWGHTPGLLLTELSTPLGPILFAGDLIPGLPWVHLPITMGYDRFPERLIDEKASLLAALLAREASLFFTHDPEQALAKLTQVTSGTKSSRYVGEAVTAGQQVNEGVTKLWPLP